MTTRVRVLHASRLQGQPFLEVDGTSFFAHVPLPEIPVSGDDRWVELDGRERLDQLADRFYGNPAYWWLLAHANNLEMPLADLYQGMRLRVPSDRFVREDLPRLMAGR